MKRRGHAGFTLLEVMVALAVVALGMSALLEVLSASAGNIAAMRDKTVAEWIALNKIADTRLSLNVPSLGVTQGDISDCARGSWHWRQEVSVVPMIPGLVNITVSVRRTGNSSPSANGSSRNNAGAGLGGPSSLATAGPLGSVSAVGASGCVATAQPGSSLDGAPALGAPSSFGAPSSLGATPQVGAQSPASAALGSAAAPEAAASSAGAEGGSAGPLGIASGSSSSSSSEPGAPSWLVTLIGFRGASLAATSGEQPTWGFATATAGSNGTPNTAPNSNGAPNGSGNNIGSNGSIGGSPLPGSPGNTPTGRPGLP